MSPLSKPRVTALDRQQLLRDLLDAHDHRADGGGVLWGSLTARGRPAANKLIAEGHARLDVRNPGGWLLKITDAGVVALHGGGRS